MVRRYSATYGSAQAAERHAAFSPGDGMLVGPGAEGAAHTTVVPEQGGRVRVPSSAPGGLTNAERIRRPGRRRGRGRADVVQRLRSPLHTRHAPRRGSRSGDLHHPARGPDPHRALAAGVQPDPPSQRPRLPSPRPRNAATPGTSHDARPGDRTHLTTGTTIGGRSPAAGLRRPGSDTTCRLSQSRLARAGTLHSRSFQGALPAELALVVTERWMRVGQ